MIHCFEVLGQGLKDVPKVVAAFGEDAFLRRETSSAILSATGIAPEDARVFDGEETKWIEVHDELATLSLFGEEGSLRVAVVKSADKLIKDSRAQLEKWCTSAPDSSLLLLSTSTLASNTKLYKLIDKRGLCVHCGLPTDSARSKTPSESKLKKWMVGWAKQQLGLKLSAPQAQRILDAVGPDCGLLHQEMSKLSLYADDSGKLEDVQIREQVGSWRTRTTWEIADAIMDGDVVDALQQLDKVFSAGEHPAAIVPQVAWSLRRYGRAAQLLMQAKRHGESLAASAAISKSGFWGEDLKKAEPRLRRIGLRRASQIPNWLLELDLQIKGSHSNNERAISALEQFCLKLS